MQSITSEIANRVRGVAAEKRYTQARMAKILGIARSSMSSRINGTTPFTGAELAILADDMHVSIYRFFPVIGVVAA